MRVVPAASDAGGNVRETVIHVKILARLSVPAQALADQS